MHRAGGTGESRHKLYAPAGDVMCSSATASSSLDGRNRRGRVTVPWQGRLLRWWVDQGKGIAVHGIFYQAERLVHNGGR